ncbi:histidine phosphatase family protein [Streptomyces flavotricini]|uniref:Histidine phosphatase family protein n=1 Tax=Streptomyces flavotricini TaxID=66888 RepID=A0ABS8E203_9ACTN|nr:histidine phosphatase family protein [Streptomyces flavotricini]MCC0094612.1 histidine phosphatase family protein [Streptomyces flavotricini]
MPEIWLMRHGAYEGHATGHHAPWGVSLSEAGRAQVAMAPLPGAVQAILTSPLPRAAQTADIVSRATGLPVIADTHLLAEWRAPSAVIGRTASDYPPAYVEWRRTRMHSPSVAFGDGESLAQLHGRACLAARHLKALSQSYGGGLLVVSHKLLLGVLCALDEGPTAFERAARDEWSFAEIRPFPERESPHPRRQAAAQSPPPRGVECALPSFTSAAPTRERT